MNGVKTCWVSGSPTSCGFSIRNPLSIVYVFRKCDAPATRAFVNVEKKMIAYRCGDHPVREGDGTGRRSGFFIISAKEGVVAEIMLS